MFDLDMIENDWKDHSFSLNEEEIIEIFRNEGATWSKYNEELAQYRKNTSINITPEERLLAIIFRDNEILKKEEELRKKYSYPEKKHLSSNSQKIIIEGCMYMVFNATREWYHFFNEKISQEKLYYVCLEALIKCVKYAIHCENPVFELYVYKCIERNVIKNIAKWEHLSYRDVYIYVHNIYSELYFEYDAHGNKVKELNFGYDDKETPESPATIVYMKRNVQYIEDYIKDISSKQFMYDYKNALDKLSEIERAVMQLSYDINGFRGLTYNEISEYLGLSKNDIANAKRRAIRKLRNNNKLNKYI
ncbi:MAG: hypothetical protein J6J17_01285 [Bacilli bacterium]|nr:hypothetical protein [Bacilli bacterium]